MSWPSLSTKLSGLPIVLAGPMLRKVTPASVTVWLVLKMSGTVTLTVLDDNGPVLTGQRTTYQIGQNLHVVAVTAAEIVPTRPFGTTLAQDTIYRYDMSFDLPNATPPVSTMTLAAATNGAALAYAPYKQPSFCLPPTDINKLRLMHGSCRHPNGEGADALAILDEQIRESAQVASTRPHQLLLSGDQIYADDVSASLLLLLSDASDVLLNWQEILPIPQADGGPQIGSKVAPYLRRTIVMHAGMTSDEADNHLMSFGEYLCMYLFVWSGVLWDAAGLPSVADVIAAVQKGDPMNDVSWQIVLTKHTPHLPTDRANVVTFRGSLDAVRRALANIPTYMILDDHDVSDDFNMTRNICTGMYGNPLGLRMVQNALVAYALCQHWGNAPEQFFDDPGIPEAPVGLKLLKLLDKGDAKAYEANATTLQQYVGVHDATKLKSPPNSTVFAVFHDADSLFFDYTIESPGHQILVTDTRTWRSFPHGGDEAPELLPTAQIDRQVGKAGNATAGRALIVVVSTNAPPSPVIRYATTHPRLTALKEAIGADFDPDLYDSWELASAPFDRLFKAISDRLPLSTAPQPPATTAAREGGAILISGDVHSSFASRLLLTGTSRFEDPQNSPQPVNAVFAQVVASSLRNQTGRTVDQHRGGYDYPSWIIGKHQPQGFVGWNLPAGVQQQVAHYAHPDMGGKLHNEPVKITGPRTRVVSGLKGKLTLDRPSDYGYRLDYLTANNENALPLPGLQTVPPIPQGATPAQRQASLDAFLKLTGNYRVYNVANSAQRQIVGINNLGEVTFDSPTTGPKRVNHTVRWIDPVTQLAMFTTYAVSLDPNDSQFKYGDVAPLQATP